MRYPQIDRVVREIDDAALAVGLQAGWNPNEPLWINRLRFSPIDCEISYCDEDLAAPDGSIVTGIVVDFVVVEGHRFPSIRAIAEALEAAEAIQDFIRQNAALIHEWARLARLAFDESAPRNLALAVAHVDRTYGPTVAATVARAIQGA